MYDYIIVGGGSAGCVLANRLSADPAHSVCLLEAGPKDNFEFIHTPGAFGFFMFSKKYDWCFEAKSDPAIRKGQPMFCPRGKTLGGSSSVNGMVYTRGHASDYDEWAELGNPGWSFEEVLPYYSRRKQMLGANIQIILIVTGAITMGMLLMYLAPLPVGKLLFGQAAPTEPGGVFMARQWGMLVFCVGALLVYAAFHLELRKPVMLAAAVEKVALGLALLSPAMRHRGMAMTVALGDLGMAAIYVLYLLGF